MKEGEQHKVREDLYFIKSQSGDTRKHAISVHTHTYTMLYPDQLMELALQSTLGKSK